MYCNSIIKLLRKKLHIQYEISKGQLSKSMLIVNETTKVLGPLLSDYCHTPSKNGKTSQNNAHIHNRQSFQLLNYRFSH